MATKKKIAIVTGQDAEAPPLSLDAEPAPEPRIFISIVDFYRVGTGNCMLTR